MKRMLVLSDFHCGHLVGLTPPQWQVDPPKSGGRTKRDKFAAIQKEAWDWYSRNVAEFGPYHAIVVNGDAIDGKGSKSGGTELITADRHEQVEMAVACIKKAQRHKKRLGSRLVLTYGTAYHTGMGEDFENEVAERVGADKIGSHEWLEMEGVVFDFKHFVGRSQVPHGRATAIDRDAIWNLIWADMDYVPRANVLVRSHVHYFKATMDEVEPRLRVVTPALQAMGSKYGSRKCSGLVSFGFMVFEARRRKLTATEPVLAKLKTQRASLLRV